MMSNFFIHTITVYHTEDDETFTPITYSGVYFRHNKKSNLIDKGFEQGSTGTILIPGTDTVNISTDDYVIEGTITDSFDLSALKASYQVYKVVSVDDNRKGHLQHYKIGVTE